MLANVVSLAANPSLTDESIITRVLHGEVEVYEILVRRYNNLLYRTARGILSDESDIEDVMQEAYIRAFENLNQFRNEARFSTWLTRILINCALRQVKSAGKHVHLDVDELNDEMPLVQSVDESDKGEIIGEGLRKALESAIDHLAPKYRVVFMLREIEHKSFDEIASLLDITKENVKIRLHRARLMLRDILQKNMNTLDVFEFHATRCTLLTQRVMTLIQNSLLR